MKISGEWFNEVEVKDFTDIEKKLSAMKVKNRSYCYITDKKGDYIQTGGLNNRFSVEVRIYDADDKFIHYKADYLLSESIEEETVLIGGHDVKVRSSQVLTYETCIELFKSFFNGEKLSKVVSWKDMTSMFL